MFNMKTSDLFKRAKQLADLEGSDFITWNEAISCINESNVALYEKLINMGDNSFVCSFRTSEKEYVLPEDFWQLKGVWLWNNGNLQTINRRADNNGIHHLSYELRNGKLYLYGNPNDVLVEYFPKPKKLYFRPNPVAIGLDSEKEWIDCHKHTFLSAVYPSQSTTKFSIYDTDGIKTKENILSINSRIDKNNAYITDNFVIVRLPDVLLIPSALFIYDISTGYYVSGITASAFLVTESGDVYIIKSDLKIYSFVITSNTNITYTDTGLTVPAFSLHSLYVSNDEMTDFFYIKNGTIWHNSIDTQTPAVKLLYSDKKCYFLDAISFFGYVDENNEVKILEQSTGNNVGFIGIDERTGYGYCSKKYDKYFVSPYCEDTSLDYPNSTYFQIIAYILAIAFRSKQDADITLLQNQLAMIEQTFEDTLGSDAFQFPRMGNVYN